MHTRAHAQTEFTVVIHTKLSFLHPTPPIHPPSLSGHTALWACLDFNLAPPSSLYLSITLSLPRLLPLYFLSYLSPHLFLLFFAVDISLSHLICTLFSQFISPFIFALLQTQVLVHRHTCMCKIVHTNTLHAHLFGHPGIRRSRCR